MNIKFAYQCPPGYGDNSIKMVETRGCERRLAQMEKYPQKHIGSKCLGCPGPVPLDTPVEVKELGASSTYDVFHGENIVPSNVSETFQDAPSAPSPIPTTPKDKIAAPGTEERHGRAVAPHIRRTETILERKGPLCPICKTAPVKFDRSGNSCGACPACVSERVRRGNRTRSDIYRQAKIVVADGGIPEDADFFGLVAKYWNTYLVALGKRMTRDNGIDPDCIHVETLRPADIPVMMELFKIAKRQRAES